MAKRTIATLALTTVLLAGCSSAAETAAETEPEAAGKTAEISPEAEAFLADHDLAGMETPEIINHLDRLGGADRPSDLMASVRVDELLVADSEQELALELPEDEFYLSVAPYVDQTHECFYHSLTTCTGQLSGEEVEVTITDDEGEVLVDEVATTFENGFVGFWLPRGVQGTVEVSYDGLSGEVEFGTSEEDPTCLTTLQLT